MAALIQAICMKLVKLRERNLGFRKYVPALIAENRWRAMRYGIDGKLIDFNVYTILREGTSADRQLDAHREHGSLRAVVDRVCEETVAGFPTAPWS